MFKYMLTLLACAAMLYQTYAEAASKSRPIRSKPKVEIAQQYKNNKLVHSQQAPRKRCHYKEQRIVKGQHLARRDGGQGRHRDGNMGDGNEIERGDFSGYQRSYDRSTMGNSAGRDFNGGRDFPGESDSEESFLGDHR